MCLGWPPEITVSMCWAHGLLFVVGVMCSPVYCLSPPILFTSSLFQSLHLCLPRNPPRLSPYLSSRCFWSCADLLFCVECVMSACTAALCLPACLPVCLFFPPRGGFVSDEAFWTSEAFNPIVWKSLITRCFLKRFMLCPSSGHKNE